MAYRLTWSPKSGGMIDLIRHMINPSVPAFLKSRIATVACSLAAVTVGKPDVWVINAWAWAVNSYLLLFATGEGCSGSTTVSRIDFIFSKYILSGKSSGII